MNLNFLSATDTTFCTNLITMGRQFNIVILVYQFSILSNNTMEFINWIVWLDVVKVDSKRWLLKRKISYRHTRSIGNHQLKTGEGYGSTSLSLMVYYTKNSYYIRPDTI